MLRRVSLAAIAAVVGIFATAACTAQSEQDSPSAHQMPSDISSTETPTGDSNPEQYEPFYNSQKPECEVIGVITENDATIDTPLFGISSGSVDIERTDGMWIETVYDLTLYIDSVDHGLWLEITKSQQDDSVDGKMFNYPFDSTRFWTESSDSVLDTDGSGGTLNATFSYREESGVEPTMIGVDISFRCRDNESSVDQEL